MHEVIKVCTPTQNEEFQWFTASKYLYEIFKFQRIDLIILSFVVLNCHLVAHKLT